MDLGKIDVNEYIGFDYGDTILIEAMSCSSKLRGSDKQIELVQYLVDKGADMNCSNEDGYNAFQIALEYHDLSKISLILLESGKLEVNKPAGKHYNCPIFTAIREYGKTWRKEQFELNNLRYTIIEKLLEQGADLEKTNKHGISAQTWVEKIPEEDKLHELINKWK
ncbi:ankyrin repeat domain-containing protein [Maribacter sp.]|uniref:ankyrin repeat domain-containing protein n=1 Tax=Maribacter sp. TaxID=1897614 RepID=UPI0032995A38